MASGEKMLFLRANAEALINMVCKPTVHVGGVWQIIVGVLYSGGKETSHAGSWITALCFCIYIVDTMTIYPMRAQYILECLKRGYIRICVYGDDHLWCCPKRVSDILNETLFAACLKKYMHMEIQDILSHDVFLSTWNRVTGELVHAGPKFLRRYFICGDDGELPVLPFKPTSDSLQKALAPKTEYVPDLILSVVGQAWDSQFTNPVSYKCLSFLYDRLTEIDRRTPIQTFEDVIRRNGPRFIHQWSKKLVLPDELFSSGFPAYRMRRTFHEWKPQNVDFRVDEYDKLVFERM